DPQSRQALRYFPRWGEVVGAEETWSVSLDGHSNDSFRRAHPCEGPDDRIESVTTGPHECKSRWSPRCSRGEVDAERGKIRWTVKSSDSETKERSHVSRLVAVIFALVIGLALGIGIGYVAWHGGMGMGGMMSGGMG